jgi:hypothetical protein
MNGDAREFERRFGSAFASLRPLAAGCPEVGVLSAFADGSLGHEETVRIEDHIAVCGLCDGLVERLKAFDSPLPSAVPVMETSLDGEPSPWQRFTRFLLHPVFAYTLTCSVFLFGFFGLLPTRRSATPILIPSSAPPPAPRPAYVNVPTLDLDAFRGGPPPHLTGVAGGGDFILAFFIPVGPSLRYEASIDGAPPVALSSYNGRGNFSLQCRRDEFTAGTHKLVITEADPDTGTKRSYEFLFEL